MNTIILILLSISLISSAVIIYLNFKSNSGSKDEDNKQEIIRLNQEIVNLKESLNTTINSTMNSMSTSFNNLSSGVTKDMTNALTQVDQKVASFNTQVENLNESQKGINQILAGVKKYGTLAEFSLGSLIKDLLPSSQYLANIKMKEDTNENVEFAIKLQDGILVPVDSHFPVERFKAIQDAHQEDDKKSMADARTKLARAFKEKAKELGYVLADNQLNDAFYRFKDLADKKKEVFDDDIVALIDDEFSKGLDVIKLISLSIYAGTEGPQFADLSLEIDGEVKQNKSEGDGPVDALFNSIRNLIPHTASLQLYQVHAVTEGTDAQAEVSVRLHESGKTVIGRGADTDTLVASARAYISALNRLMVKREKSVPEEIAN